MKPAREHPKLARLVQRADEFVEQEGYRRAVGVAKEGLAQACSSRDEQDIAAKSTAAEAYSELASELEAAHTMLAEIVHQREVHEAFDVLAPAIDRACSVRDGGVALYDVDTSSTSLVVHDLQAAIGPAAQYEELKTAVDKARGLLNAYLVATEEHGAKARLDGAVKGRHLDEVIEAMESANKYADLRPYVQQSAAPLAQMLKDEVCRSCTSCRESHVWRIRV